jgi:hypothetical protein
MLYVGKPIYVVRYYQPQLASATVSGNILNGYSFTSVKEKLIYCTY